jgi:teichuronic acid biosynthesis glycosyltransferase TuaG
MLSKTNSVDIIMPNFNKGKFILKAVNSVLSQSYENWKLYIIDDNSNDNSKEVIKKFSNHKKVKTLLLKKNKGPSYCRNLILKKSKSKFIAFLDSDDYWTKNKLKSQIIYMVKNKFPFTYTDYLPLIQNENIKRFLNSTNILKTFTFDKFIKNSSINTSTMIIERKYIKNLKFRNLNLMEDYIFKCELMKKSKIPFKKFPKTTAIYRIIKKSRSSKRINNIKNLWIINNRFNKLSFFQNIISIISISLNSIKKYGFK